MDEVLGALVQRLQVMPASDPQSRAAILARVRGRRQSPWRATLAWAWQPSVPVLAAAAVAVITLGIGYGSRVLVEPSSAVTLASEQPATTGATATTVANDISSARAVPTQFVFEAPGANRVVLVGDFNGWDAAKATVLQDPEHRGVWEATVLLPPGRHTYAFYVNDSLMKLDPRAPKTEDPDFGRASSVVLVTR
ncbi:MAG TPA: hypothetical protein VE967_02100 [Gemmatimonadaceae bacterium]|nr:hypothetical protein [Gemmatimonadaceae bacterium]